MTAKQAVTKFGEMAMAVAAVGGLLYVVLSAVFETKVAHSLSLAAESQARTEALREVEAAHGRESRRVLCYLEEMSKPRIADRNTLRCEQVTR